MNPKLCRADHLETGNKHGTSSKLATDNNNNKSVSIFCNTFCNVHMCHSWWKQGYGNTGEGAKWGRAWCSSMIYSHQKRGTKANQRVRQASVKTREAVQRRQTNPRGRHKIWSTKTHPKQASNRPYVNHMKQKTSKGTRSLGAQECNQGSQADSLGLRWSR